MVDDGEFSAAMATLGWSGAALGIAVSGGPDSMALLLLLRDWAAARGTGLQAFTVDHGLRPDAAAEAEQVGRWCAALQVPHETLLWVHHGVSGRVQERARRARYDLLAAACARHDLGALALAHHQDDQAETVLLRLAKGSGLDGLAGMRPVGRWEATGLTLLRPLLNMPKVRLITTCQARGQEFFRDPGNEAPRYARGRLRAASAALAAEGMDSARLADLARRAAVASDALTVYTDRLQTRALRWDEAGYAELSLSPMWDEPEEIQMRALAGILRRVGGAVYAPPQEAVRALLVGVRAGKLPRRTLAGCEIAAQDGVCRVMRELAAIASPVPLAPGQSLRWDGRFVVSLTADAPSGLTVGALGLRDHAALDRIAPGLRQRVGMGRVRAALPALYAGDVLHGVPGYGQAAAWATAGTGNER